MTWRKTPNAWPNWTLISRIRKMEQDLMVSNKHGAKSPVVLSRVEKTAPMSLSSNEDAVHNQEYINRPAGELDMLIGFFLMNGVCIVFFLMFGLCVIFSCLRRRPRMFREVQKPPVPQAEQPLIQKEPSRFKSRRTSWALVSKAMKTADFAALAAAESVENSPKKESKVVALDGQQVQVHVVDEHGPAAIERKSSKVSIEHEVGEGPEPKSVIRENLLGPLTFDDLYYT